MSNPVEVYKHRTNKLQVNLGVNVTGDTFASQIRSDLGVNSPLIATWQVTVLDAINGILLLTLDDTITSDIQATSGFMDIKRISGGEPVPVGNRAIEVTFIPAVTA